MEIFLKEHIETHPELLPQDIIKFCFQAAFGAEHLLSDKEFAGKYLHEEFSNTKAMDIPLYELLSDNYCRVNIAGWKYRNLSEESLLDLFFESVSNSKYSVKEDICYVFKLAADVIFDNCSKDFFKAWKDTLDEYIRSGIHAVHHSDHYREVYSPSYRVVSLSLLKEKCSELFEPKNN